MARSISYTLTERNLLYRQVVLESMRILELAELSPQKREAIEVARQVCVKAEREYRIRVEELYRPLLLEYIARQTRLRQEHVDALRLQHRDAVLRTQCIRHR